MFVRQSGVGTLARDPSRYYVAGSPTVRPFGPTKRTEEMNGRRKIATSRAKPSGGSAGECTLRIIGGKFRGRRILYHGDPATRPMKDRVREAVFNLVGPAVKNTHVIDLFAGTGAIGLEGLSRGAARAVFIERHFPTVATIRENADSLGVRSDVEIVGSDTFFWALREGGLSNQPVENAWLVFCSPPYAFFADRTDEMLELIRAAFDSAPAESMIVVESDERFDIRTALSSILWDVRDYPPARIAIAKK